MSLLLRRSGAFADLGASERREDGDLTPAVHVAHDPAAHVETLAFVKGEEPLSEVGPSGRRLWSLHRTSNVRSKRGAALPAALDNGTLSRALIEGAPRQPWATAAASAELLALRWWDVDLETGIGTVRRCQHNLRLRRNPRRNTECGPPFVRHVLARAGIDMCTVSQALGHRNTLTTECAYLGVVPDAEARARGAPSDAAPWDR